MTNPLIADNASDTVQNAADALSALHELMAQNERLNGIAVLLTPIIHALEKATR